MSFIGKTFGGLSKAYYFRNLFFGSLLYILLEVTIFNANKGVIDHKFILITLMLTGLLLLYPYSRFVYESIVGYIFGDNVFFVNILLMFSIKIMTIGLCFAFSWAIAPVGLIYLYFYHTKQEKLANLDQDL
ncbi:hypothetical protein ACFFHT_10905 [Gallibacterium melopsittaci]|uniref:Uncharacterized protein n=1 Tax=Gallibacterium melopsittaci TaxID=516063 RepID=A0ABV6I103_9PAST